MHPVYFWLGVVWAVVMYVRHRLRRRRAESASLTAMDGHIREMGGRGGF